MIQEMESGRNFRWIAVEFNEKPADAELLTRYDIDETIIAYAIDKHERAHMEYDPDESELILIVNALNPEQEDNHYETIPVTFVIRKQRIVSIVDEESDYLLEKMQRILKNNPDLSVYDFLFSSVVALTASYFPVLDAIDKEKDRLNRILRQYTTKKNLLALSDLATGIVYLQSAANQNVMTLEQTRSSELARRLSDDEKERLDEALIEARQLFSMNAVLSELLEHLSGTYNNILNNNLNANLTNLNILAILLAVLAVITGFYGMNVKLPLAEYPLAWLYICGGGALIVFVLLKILRRIFPKEH